MLNIIRRLRIRSAYNRGDYERARKYSRSLLNNSKNGLFAQDICIRSLYNEGDHHGVIEFSKKWGMSNHGCSKKSEHVLWLSNPSENSLPSDLIELQQSQPQPIQSIIWDGEDVCSNFLQEASRVWFKTPDFCVYWDVPEDYCLEKTHPALLQLIAEVLLPHEHSIRQQKVANRPKGTRLSLSFSAGTDSTACALLMPKDTVLGYHRRSFNSLLNHQNADFLLSKLNEDESRTVISIPSNHELLRTFWKKPVGFSSDFACATHLMLLADYYDLNGIAFGMPVDNTFLWKGRRFRDYPNLHSYEKWVKRFRRAGLDYLLPISSISEAGAMRICAASEYADFLNSCMRSESGCGHCWKCFHKNGPLGRPVNLQAREIVTYLSKRPFPTTTHALWALQQYGREDMLPDLQHLFEIDYSWWEGYYSPGFKLLPLPIRKHIQPQIERLLEPMPEPFVLETLNHFNEPEGP